MTVTIRLPTVLRRLAGDEKDVTVDAADVASAMQRLAAKHPQLGSQLLDEDGGVRPFVKVFVGSDEIRDLDGAATKLDDGATLRIVPAIAGGSAR